MVVKTPTFLFKSSLQASSFWLTHCIVKLNFAFSLNNVTFLLAETVLDIPPFSIYFFNVDEVQNKKLNNIL